MAGVLGRPIYELERQYQEQERYYREMERRHRQPWPGDFLNAAVYYDQESKKRPDTAKPEPKMYSSNKLLLLL